MNNPTSGRSWPVTEYGLPASPLTRDALHAQARINNGARITPAPAAPGRAAFTVTFPDVATAIAFATTIEAIGWRCDTQLARHIADLTDPVTLTVTGPPPRPARAASGGAPGRHSTNASTGGAKASTGGTGEDPADDEVADEGSAETRYLVTVTETVTYRMRVTARSAEEAEEVAEEEFCAAEDTDTYFFSVDERDFDADPVDDPVGADGVPAQCQP